jgi:diguanylate cyclase (GGDEF)-like protein
MKIENTPPARGTRSVAAKAYARTAGTAPPVSEVAATAAASVLGIPEGEFTPRVREAIMALMQEVDALRRELQETRSRLDDAEKTADQDQLLPVLGRRAFVRELTRHIAITDRYKTPASLIYFDMNYLKKINDSFGHAAGDAMLQQFAQVLTDNVRDTDTVGRLGGDEFGVLLTHATYEQAIRKADALATVLRASPITWNGRTIAVSFAYGAFEVQPGDNADIAMTRADEAMYAQKRGTRAAAE